MKNDGLTVVSLRLHRSLKDKLEKEAEWMHKMGLLDYPTVSELVRLFIFRGLYELEKLKSLKGVLRNEGEEGSMGNR